MARPPARVTSSGQPEERRGSRTRTRALRALRRNPAGSLGLIITVVVVLGAIFGPLFAPYNPTAADLNAVLSPPSATHLLGTDQLGRDILTRIIYGARVSLLIGFLTVAIAGTIGTIIGTIAGYVGGWLDTVVMRIVDVQLSFPFILLALTINAIVGIGFRNILVSLVLAGWVVYARVARAETLKIKEREFVEAARGLGGNDLRIIFRHVVPMLLPPMIILSTLQVAQFMVAEAAISFLGFGIQPPTPAWGNMMADGRDYLFTSPWLVTFPGLALAITVLGINLLGDWFRDVLDPRFQP